MGGQIGHTGDQRQAVTALLFIAGDQTGTDGVGRDHRIGPLFPQQLFQLVQHRPVQRRMGVGGQSVRHTVIGIEQPVSIGHQQVKRLVKGLGAVRHGIGKKVQHLRLRSGKIPADLLPQRL